MNKWLWLGVGFAAGWLFANRSTVLFAAQNSGKIGAAASLVSDLQALGVSP